MGAGTHVTVTLGDGTGSGWLAFAIATRLPSGGLFLPLPVETAVILPQTSLGMSIPLLPGVDHKGTLFVMQGITLDPISSKLLLSNTTAVRVDW